MTFQDLGLSAPILTSLKEEGYTQPTPIQEKAIPPALAGRDILGCAQTGTGKTCAFAAPILQRLDADRPGGRPIRALILTPTRELAIQIGDCFRDYGSHLRLRHTVIFGGVGQNPQVEALDRGTDILVATPGRLIDLHDQGHVSFDGLQIFVLDEADRMLDMGFIHDVRRILRWLPQKKQTMLFSATMPAEIASLASSLLHSPVRVAVDPVSSPVEAIRQCIYPVDRENKTRLLAHLMEQFQVRSALVFTRTKHGANKVARDLEKTGIHAAAIHGNKSQTARQQALADFKSGAVRCLVATDIAARGLDIEELSHVFNYNLPEVPETYVHRIGRTGRAGRGGTAISFCDCSELPMRKDIEKLLGHPIPEAEENPFPMRVFEAPQRDRNGRIVNEEDAEARAAAREKRREQDEARKAAAREKRQDEAAASARAAQALSESGGKKKRRRNRKGTEDGPEEQPAPQTPNPEPVPESSRRRGRKAAAQEPPKTVSPPAPEPEEDDYEPSWASWTSRDRTSRSSARPGLLMDTGDSLPRTEFTRPNPLDGDSIMDATARLLAPRRSAAPQPSRTEAQPESQGKGKRHRGKKGPSAPPPEPPKPQKAQKKQPQQPTQSGGKKESRNAGGKGRGKKEASSGRDSRRRGSQEQPSLMKPFYLDFGS